MEKRIHRPVIVIIILLMLAGVWVLFSALDFLWISKTSPLISGDKEVEASWGAIPTEVEVFKGLVNASKWSQVSSQSQLREKSLTRAYPGAPPQIPHNVSENVAASGKKCLSCHGNGGFSKRFGAYAPVAPHPQYVSCRQCHVVKKTPGFFRSINWAKTSGAPRGFSHLPGSPPIIPHPLHLRGNCLSCHSGPSAAREIRTTHPERINCRQCHVPMMTGSLFPPEGGEQ